MWIWSCDLPHFCVISCNTLLSACGKMASVCSASKYANRRTETKFSLHVSHIQNNMPLGDYYSEERETCTGKSRERSQFLPSMSMFYTWQVQRNLRLTSINRACDKITLWCTLLPFYTHQNWHSFGECANPPESYQKHFSLLKLFVQDWESKSVTAARGPLWW